MNLLIVTGLSGAGKSSVLDFLEDSGYFCVDNLPIPLIQDLVVRLQKIEEVEQIALGIDSRNIHLEKLDDVIDKLIHEGIHVIILFLDASDEVLLRRYSQTRRVHPLAKNGNIQEGINRERKQLAPLKEKATYYIDTSDLKPTQIFNRLIDMGILQTKDFVLAITSFGFKRGLPPDADIVFDVRFVPNPFWIESMKKLSGKDQAVIDYIMSFDQTHLFLNQFTHTLHDLLPYYRNEGKKRLNIAIGCTGGQHRSVCIADELAKKMAKNQVEISIQHRDLHLMNID